MRKRRKGALRGRLLREKRASACEMDTQSRNAHPARPWGPRPQPADRPSARWRSTSASASGTPFKRLIMAIAQEWLAVARRTSQRTAGRFTEESVGWEGSMSPQESRQPPDDHQLDIHFVTLDECGQAVRPESVRKHD